MRIGHGYDVHRFGAGDHIVLGGVTIPHSRGLEAHSDGDVLIHALCDALLGALALGDIGELGNADITLIAQTPRLSPHKTAMVANLAADCRVETAAINVKATTTEKLGFTGREEGIACHAVVLLVPAG